MPVQGTDETINCIYSIQSTERRSILKKILSIGEFAKISLVCRKTLIWYDNTDLFKPAITDTNGYRYYRYDQIYTISMIQMLLELGLSHNQIREYMKKTNPEAARELLQTQRGLLEKELLRIRSAMDVISSRLDSLDEASVSDTGISICHMKASPVFISRDLGGIRRDEIGDDIWDGYYTDCDKHGNGFGYPEGLVVRRDAVEDGTGSRISCIAGYVSSSKYANSSMPEGDYLVYQGIGGMDDTGPMYAEIRKYISGHSLSVAGDAWEKRIIDEGSAEDKAEHRIRIAVPIESTAEE